MSEVQAVQAQQPDPIRVLVVEDDEEDFIITNRLLRDGGQKLEVRREGALESGIAWLARNPCDVVLLDLCLPDSQGWTTFTRLHEQSPSAAIILLTGMTDEALGIRAVQEGAQDYLTKGKVGRDQLVRSIRYAVERKRTDAALREARDQLEARVKERTAELARANEELREAVSRLEEHDRAKNRFVSNVSHELRTPLSSIHYAVENLLRGVVGPVPEGVRHYLVMVREDCMRLRNTVDEILDLSRLDAGTLTLNRARTPLIAIVRRVLDAVRPQAEAGERRLTLSHTGEPAFADCDAAKMERSVLNVVNNAIKFSAAGGTVAVTVGLDPQSPAMVMIQVEDDGIGIPPEHLGRVSERYFRVGEQVDGTGLGLSICREIIELHGGSMTIKSPPPGKERGTQVQMRLPAARRPAALAVDDDEIIQNLIKRELSALGYEVAICSSGQDALTAVLASRPDLLLVDLLMPGMDGVELVAKIKANSDTRSLPILVVTGAQMDLAKHKILDTFGIPVLHKPWRTAEFARRVEDAYAGRRRQEQAREVGVCAPAAGGESAP